MDIYKPLVEMLESRKIEFAEVTSLELVKQGYLANEPASIAAERKGTLQVFEIIIECIRTGDSTAWRKVSSIFGDELNKQGRSVEDFEKFGTIYYERMKDMVEQAFADQPKLKATFLRRIESLTMVGNVSTITNMIAKKTQN